MATLKTLTNTDVKQIAVLPFQRQASVRQTLVNSMKEHGFLGTILMIRSTIITGAEQLYIIDGQHRFLAARLLNLPIAASIIEINTTKEHLVQLISTLNSTGQKWTIGDYINAYASLNNQSYVNLLKLATNCKKLSLASIANIVTRKNHNIIKNGKFTLTDDINKQIMQLNNLLCKIPKQSIKDMEILFDLVDNKAFNENVFVANYLDNINTLTPLLPSEKERIYNSWFTK